MASKIRFSWSRIFFLIALLGLGSCKTITIPSYNAQKPPPKPDYTKERSWAVLPTVYPENLKHWQTVDSLFADVFYIYPTLNVESEDLRWNIPVTDVKQHDKIINKAVYFQASAFINAGELYVPIYRQAHLRAYFSPYNKNEGKKALDLAYSDVKDAFEVYLKKYNNGKPIIIAAHSQGTTHAIRLLKDFFDGKPLQNKLVIAYLPGIGIKKEVFKHIPLLTSPTQTGGFVTWNTYKKNYYPKSYDLWFKGKAVTNPITWDNTLETNRDAHKGFLFTNGKLYKHALKVYVKDGLLWTTLPRFPYRIFALRKKRYHTGDINLFWEDIRENAVLRVQSYFEKTKKQYYTN